MRDLAASIGIHQLKKQRGDATTVFQKFLEELKSKVGQNDGRVVQLASSLQPTLHRLKADRTALVSTIVGRDRLYIIVTTAATQRAHIIDYTEKDVNKLVAEFRRVLTSPTRGEPVDPRPAGQKLYDILVKPIEGDLAGINADTILWSLDGTLRYVPVSALWDKEKGYLVERFSSTVLTLASRDTLMIAPEEKKGQKALGVGVSEATDGFAALTAVPDELDCIITDLITKAVSAKPLCTEGVIGGEKLLNEKFTETAFQDAMGRFSIVHIASHFNLVPGNDNDSFLLLGGGENKRFTVQKLRGETLTNIELLVLSACNTATPGGEKTSGVEVEGFGAVAQSQGAKAVIASLWSVADPSTRDFMVEFYRLYKGGTLTKTEFVRQAQLKLMNGTYELSEAPKRRDIGAFTTGAATNTDIAFKKEPKAPYSHPYYWAPFVLIGNWR